MYGTLKRFALRNPPWVDEDIESAAFSYIDDTEGISVDLSFYDAVQAKLASIDTSQSVELQRFVVSTAYEFAGSQVKWVEPEPPKPLLYDAYGVPTSYRETVQQVGLISTLLPEEQVQLLAFGAYHQRITKLFLLDLVFRLIDKVVAYWNEVSLARRAWRCFSGAFRQFLESALQFKPFHTPLRLFPNSIHPIGSAA